jgi:hypothetical protein
MKIKKTMTDKAIETNQNNGKKGNGPNDTSAGAPAWAWLKQPRIQNATTVWTGSNPPSQT